MQYYTKDPERDHNFDDHPYGCTREEEVIPEQLKEVAPRAGPSIVAHVSNVTEL